MFSALKGWQTWHHYSSLNDVDSGQFHNIRFNYNSYGANLILINVLCRIFVAVFSRLLIIYQDRFRLFVSFHMPLLHSPVDKSLIRIFNIRKWMINTFGRFEDQTSNKSPTINFTCNQIQHNVITYHLISNLWLNNNISNYKTSYLLRI